MDFAARTDTHDYLLSLGRVEAKGNRVLDDPSVGCGVLPMPKCGSENEAS